MSRSSGACDYCRSRPVFFDRHLSLAPMQGLWREIVHRWKYENDRRLWRLFWDLEPGLTTGRERVAELRQAGIDRIVWIDSGSSGRHLRNFQPCADLARSVASILKPVYGAGADLRKGRANSRAPRALWIASLPCITRWNSAARAWPDVACWSKTSSRPAQPPTRPRRILKKNGALQVIVFSLLLRDGRAA